MSFRPIYFLLGRLLAFMALRVRDEGAKDAELLVLRHEIAVLRRQVPHVRYQPAVDCGSPRSAGYSPVCVGSKCSP